MPAELHPQRGELGLFVDGKLAAEDNRRVVRHLLAGCEPCRRLTSELWRPAAAGDTAVAVDRAVSAVSERQAGIEAERAVASGLLRELDAQPASRQLLLVLNSRRFRNWFLCEALLARAFETGLSEPQAAIRLAEIGVALAGQLAKAASDEDVNHDLLAFKLAQKTEAYRCTEGRDRGKTSRTAHRRNDRAYRSGLLE